ncbi:MAG: AAA family ATPase [Schwartzia sp.]|nr:AAA family ATPase [Schwartzia sp. (in: firmicutes)]
MFIKTITAENFKGLKKTTVEFSSGVNLIIGNNGSGKTSLMEALAIALGTGFIRLNGIAFPDMGNNNVRWEYNREGTATHSLIYRFPQRIAAELQWDEKQIYPIGLSRNGEAEHPTFGQLGFAAALADALKDSKANLPLFSFQKFNRDWNTEMVTTRKEITVETGLTLRVDAYQRCLDSATAADKIQRWCLKMAIMEYEQQRKLHEFQLFQAALKRFMQIMLEIEEDIKIAYSIETRGMEIGIGEKKESIHNLSTGYRVILSMIMELAYRTVVLNPEAENFDNQEGVVLIDEIDAHLHPRWQWKVLDALRNIFPRVQFIVATHSPIVISSVRDARIIKMDLDVPEELETAYGYTMDDVLELRQGSLSRPAEVEQSLKHLEDEIADGNFVEAEKIVRQAETKYGKASSVYREMDDLLRLNRWVEAQE